MSLYSKPQPPAVPASYVLQREVGTLKQIPRRMAEQIFNTWSQAFDLMWSSANGVVPADRLAALGPAAAELFASNTAIVTLLLTVVGDNDPDMKAGIESRVAAIPAHTIHQDGTVTLD